MIGKNRQGRPREAADELVLRVEHEHDDLVLKADADSTAAAGAEMAGLEAQITDLDVIATRDRDAAKQKLGRARDEYNAELNRIRVDFHAAAARLREVTHAEAQGTVLDVVAAKHRDAARQKFQSALDEHDAELNRISVDFQAAVVPISHKAVEIRARQKTDLDRTMSNLRKFREKKLFDLAEARRSATPEKKSSEEGGGHEVRSR